MNREDRPAPRRQVRLSVELTFPRSELRLFGESRNMSSTGMLVVSEDPKPPGTVVRFRFDELGLGGQARVVWGRQDREGSLLGMQFIELDARSQDAVARILSDAVPWN